MPQGIQAQTVAHMQLIRNKNLKVIPVLNKIDLATAKVADCKRALEESFGFEENDIIEISAKANINIDKVLQAIIEKIPPPVGDSKKPLRALVFSSQYHSHKGVIIHIRIFDGQIDMVKLAVSQADPSSSMLQFMASKASFSPIEIGYFHPEMKVNQLLSAGEVGYIATGLKDLSLARIGDTLGFLNSEIKLLEGYREPKPMVYLCLYPTSNDDFLILRDSLEKLHLSDCSFSYKLHSSAALGKGYLCGFLGLLHADVIRERLEKEFNLSVIATAPTVEYQLNKKNGETVFIHTPEDFPDPSLIESTKEPMMFTTIYTPKETVGNVMQLCEEKRGKFINMEYILNQVQLTYILPLAEMILNFFDNLKSISSGYASLDYEFYEYETAKAVKLEILINKKPIDAFSQIVIKEQAIKIANKLVDKLKDNIPRHQFQIPIQAALGGTIIARSDVKSFRKDVTQKLYGGDRTRKDKLLEAQKRGKKRLRQFGQVEIPQEAFFNLYKQE